MLAVNGIKKAYGTHQVLKGISFEVPSGSIYGLIGRNGAGKTTLMKIISGLLDKNEGAVSFGEGESKVSFLPDLPAFFEYLTTDEYLDFLLMDENPIRRNNLLEMVSLSGGLRIKTLSRGMRQRLGIAAALTSDPQIILLDEPTSALDPEGRAQVRQILENLKEKGKTILLSTHILADMDSICDKAGFLKDGVIALEVDSKENREKAAGFRIRFENSLEKEQILSGIPTAVFEDDRTICVMMDEKDPLGSQQQIFRHLSGLSNRMESMESTAKSLDQIFREVCL
ncbi:MAG: ABC transporter ATP-binding protein [Lachnospiraceae bacterium]|nr:ABC transporter ATP-binding protein [Lachnospiraceae bacterium]